MAVIGEITGELREKVKEAYRVTLPSLFTSQIFGLFGGTFLGKYFEIMRTQFPGLLVVLPGIMGLRGNVFGSMASRFSTMLYLGDLEPSLRDRKVLKEIVLRMLISLIPIVLLWAIGVATGVKKNALDVLLIVVTSTILVSFILGYFTSFVTIFAFKRGTDPDSVAAPLVASMGDFLTVPSLVLFILLIEHSPEGFRLFNYAVLALFAAVAAISRVRKAEFVELKQVFITITGLALLSTVSGSILARFSGIIQASVILSFIYPSLLSSFGNYGSIIAAKTSTKLHLGEIESFVCWKPLTDILALFTTAPIIGATKLLIGIALVKLTTGMTVPGSAWLVVLTYPFMVLFIMLYSYTVSYFLFRKNIDPDHVAIPLISNNSDIFGTIYVVLMAKLMVGG
ncbi:magnesium transporter [Thermococcus camini]|uniref:Divalent cation transporter, MgtE-like protein n=1 Tax=Thermococcus camini TaxID=2016373 RepID=A0A7G2D8T1_9EURY|nr:magnesium transporter [Thermococcus camini]CAD5244623.1 Divalent cation transporter, MgtE-like protein [Thermococcus camini]